VTRWWRKIGRRRGGARRRGRPPGCGPQEPTGGKPEVAIIGGVGKEELRQEVLRAQAEWNRALQAHKLAPPDDGFGRRLERLAAAARAQAHILRRGHALGYTWSPNPEPGRPPYELRPGSGRRGPEDLWCRFDEVVELLDSVGAGTDLLAIARAQEQLADVAARLAVAVAPRDSS
jgi:hypothetical protein